MAKVSFYFVIVFVMLMWGFNVVAIKILIHHLPPITMQGARIFLSGLTVLTYIWMIKHYKGLSKREWIYSILAGFLGITGHHFFLATGLMYTSASNAGIILALSPLTTSILAVLFLDDRLTKLRIVGILLGLVGVTFVVLKGSGEVTGIAIGDILIFAGMLSQAFSFILIKKQSTTLDPKLMTGIMLTSGAIFLVLISFVADSNGIQRMAVGDPKVWMIFLFSAVFATGIGQLLYNMAIQKVGPAKTTIFNNLMPFFALIGSVLFIGEHIYMEQILGFIFIVSGVLLGTGVIDEVVNKRALKKKNEHESEMPF
jgi:drug/metabolite transporter (DMT)-like permease